MNLQYQNKLLNYFIPVLYLHPNEEISPISIKEYINNCELCINCNKSYKNNIFKKSNIIKENKEILLDKGKIYLPLNTTLSNIPNKYLHYKGDYYLPNPLTINQVPIYGLVQEYNNFIDIIYIFNYYYNNPYKLFCINIGGEHQADIKHIRIRIDNNNLYNQDIPFNIKSIYYSAHSSEQGRWVKPNEIEWYNNKKNRNPIIYVAKDSHSNYNKSGTWYRTFGLANDYTKEKNAIKWKPENVINLHERDDLMSYRGDMDNNGIKDLNKFIQESPPHEKTYSTFLYRFFYPLSESLSKSFNCCSSRK